MFIYKNFMKQLHQHINWNSSNIRMLPKTNLHVHTVYVHALACSCTKQASNAVILSLKSRKQYQSLSTFKLTRYMYNLEFD